MRSIQSRTRSRHHRFAAAAAALFLIGDATAQTTLRASEGTGGLQANNISRYPDVSADGRFVAFDTSATNLSGAAPGDIQVMVRDRDPDGNGVFDEGNETTSLVSRKLFTTLPAQGDSVDPSISADGRYVAFASTADDLAVAPVNGKTDVFVADRDPDGNGVFEPTNIFIEVVLTATGNSGTGHSNAPEISLDGRYVTFWSQATNMVVPDVNGSKPDIFRFDRLTNQVERVNNTPAGSSPNQGSTQHAVSGDGQRVVFQSTATDIVAGPVSGLGDVYVRDFTAGTTTLASVSTSGALANAGSGQPAISGDGSTVAFSSQATNLDPRDADPLTDVYVRDLSAGTTELASLDSFGVKTAGNGSYAANAPRLSNDGAVVCFLSSGTDLYYNQTSLEDVYVRDRVTGQTNVVSVDSGGYAGNAPSGETFGHEVSADGGTVVYYSRASNLTSLDTNGVADIFAHEVCNPVLDQGHERVGSNGFSPVLEACGGLATGQTLTFRLRHAPPMMRSAIFLSPGSNPRPWFGGTLVPAAPAMRTLVKTDPNGEASFTINSGGGQPIYAQWLMRDVGLFGYGFSNAVCAPMLP